MGFQEELHTSFNLF